MKTELEGTFEVANIDDIEHKGKYRPSDRSYSKKNEISNGLKRSKMSFFGWGEKNPPEANFFL